MAFSCRLWKTAVCVIFLVKTVRCFNETMILRTLDDWLFSDVIEENFTESVSAEEYANYYGTTSEPKTTTSPRDLSETEFVDYLLENYDARLRPHPQGTPTEVRCSVAIDSIDSIDVMYMEYTVHILLAQWWMDKRLAYEHLDYKIPHNRTFIAVDARYLHAIWRPNMFFENEHDGHFHELTKKNFLFKIYPSGKIWYSVRLTLVLSCQMWLAKYPLDSQTCPVTLQSYGLTTEEQILRWRKSEPIMFTKEITLPQFQYGGYDIVETVMPDSIGNFSTLILDLAFHRALAYHMVASYIPMLILVMVSWVSFWLESDAVVGRVSLGIMTLLTVNSLSYTVGKDLPIVSYAKAIDIWTGACSTFVFGAFLEYAFVSYVDTKAKNKKQKQKLLEEIQKQQEEEEMQQKEAKTELIFEPSEGSTASPTRFGFDSDETETNGVKHRKPKVKSSNKVTTRRRNPYKPPMSAAKRIDIVSRIVFPLLFTIFNIVYWVFYTLICCQSGYQTKRSALTT